jgi:hypothetical protein
MAPTDPALGIVLTVRIGHIGSDPFGGFGVEVAAIRDFAGCLQGRACYVVANTHAHAFAWPTSLESLE